MTARLRLLAPLLVAVAVAAAACGGAASPPPAASEAPATSAPTASEVPAESAAPAVCEDAAAFRASLETLTGLRLIEVGTSGVKAAVDDVKTSAEALLVSGRELVGPPLTDLLASVTALQATLAGLGDQPSLGAGLAAVRTAIAEIRAAADEVEATLGASCPTP